MEQPGGAGTNHLALPKRWVRVPLGTSPWPGSATPVARGFYSLPGLVIPQGRVLEKEEGEEENERGEGGGWPRSCCPLASSPKTDHKGK